MGGLDGKKGLIFGIANKYSIAWGIAQALHGEGAELGFSYAGEVLTKRVEPLADSIGVTFVEMCDVTDDAQIDTLFNQAADHFGSIDFLVHSIAFAPREVLGGQFVDTSRDAFKLTLDVSCYSLVALARHARDLMPNGGSIMTMTAYGSEKVLPNYNVMGVAKAALECTVRYLAWDLSEDGIRVNAVSASPIKTLSSAVISGFRKALRYSDEASPLGNAAQEDVGDAACFLLNDQASKITGQVLYVDGGYSIMGSPTREVLE